MNSEIEKIIVEVLRKRGDRNIIVHSAEKAGEDYIRAIVSYDWYLNGHKKEVKHINVSMCKDDESWICL